MTAPPRALRHILLAEDDADIQEVAVLALEEVGGFRVTACDSGASALRAMRQNRPDLVLLDWMMPVLDGGQVALVMREQGFLQDIPLIFMTAKARPEEINRMMDLGAADVITKPFNVMQLPGQIQRLWDAYWAKART